MKGMIFTEFLEMVEDKFGFDMLDTILGDAHDPQEGVYTAVNTYSHTQLVDLVVALHKKTEIPLPDLLKVYGRHLFAKLVENYPSLITGITDPFVMLVDIEVLIHTEVRKLYPEANPPKFYGKILNEKTLELHYESHRSMGDVAEGLILGCGDYFNIPMQVEQTSTEDDGKKVGFLIPKLA
jgi:hypothetical protein